MLLQIANFHCFLWLSNIPLCVYACVCVLHCIFLSQLCVDRHLGCFHVLATVNSAAMNIGVRVSFCIIVFSGYMPRSGIAVSYASSIFSILRNI